MTTEIKYVSGKYLPVLPINDFTGEVDDKCSTTS